MADHTHSQLITGAIGSSVALTTLGTLTLPADGPWRIHNIYGQLARATATAAEAITAKFNFRSPTGDLTPDPQPSNWPMSNAGSFLGASAPAQNAPLSIFDVDWEAAGKGTISIAGALDIAATVAPIAVLGVVYGPDIPVVRRFKFCDQVQGTHAAATEAQIGTLTLSEKATRITGLCGVVLQDGVLVTAEELIGFFRLDSDDVLLSPSSWPFNDAYGAGLGTVIGSGGTSPIRFIPVDIPVPGGSRINVFTTFVTAVTNPADVAVYIAYE